MTDQEPPEHVTGGPPSRGRNQPPVDRKAAKEARDALEAEAARLVAHFNGPVQRGELEAHLPYTTRVDQFVTALKMALLRNAKLAAPALRPSLMRSVEQAARVGLMPDGKEGALVVRNNWDPDLRQSNPEVCWQPMVWGIVKLGRQTGSIQSIRANIVFNNEPFRYVQGDQDLIEHEVKADVVETAYADLQDGRDNYGNLQVNVDRFLTHVRGAYCIITSNRGEVTKRYMTRARLMSLRQTAKAKSGPWNSPFVDEMILKAVILFTAKWINLDGDTVAAQAFQQALLTDQEIDLDAEPVRHEPARLEAPGTKLDQFEKVFSKPPREMAEIRGEDDPPQQQAETAKEQTKPEYSDFPGDENYRPPPPKAPKRTPEGDEAARVWGGEVSAELALCDSKERFKAIVDDAAFERRLQYLRHVDLPLAHEIEAKRDDLMVAMGIDP